MIRYCVFDLDGTVLNTLETIAYYGNNALENNGIEPIPLEAYKYLVGNGIVNLVKNMLNYRGCMSEDTFEKVFRDYDSAYNADTSYMTKPYDGICETLERLKSLGIKIAIVSNKPHFATTGVINTLFGQGYFDCVYGQREGFPIKPDPTTVLQVLSDLDAQQEECLYIGDTGTDMKTGRNAGIYTVGVLWGFRSKEELIQNGANLTIEKPHQLLEHILDVNQAQKG